MRKRLLIGNLKLNGTKSSLAALLTQLKNQLQNTVLTKTQLVILPPAIFLDQVEKALQNTVIAWGGQTMSEYSTGAYTGEISGDMLLEFGCQYVLLGHAERRQLYQESDAMILNKLRLAGKLGLIPVLCLGETWAQYQLNQAKSAIINQLKRYLSLEKETLKKLVIAYEPIWAIGTGNIPSPAYVQTMHATLRSCLAQCISRELAHKTRILYGGSLKPDNARTLFAMPDVDGGLIGSAALSADTFLTIYNSLLEQ